MSTVQFKRSPRLAAPRQPGGEVHLEPPPEVPRVIPGNILMKLMPVIMIVAMLGMVALMFTLGGAAGRNPITLLFPMMMMFSMVGMFGQGRGGGQKKAEMNEDRKDYLRYLGQMRDRAREASLDQRAALEWVHPDPQALWSMATSRRMWERRQSDPDFCHLRAGRGSQRLATRLVPPQTGPVDELEPIATLALRRFVRAHSIVPELPIQIAIRGFAAVSLSGEKELTRGLARALIGQLVTFHTPDDVLVAIVTSGRTKEEWEWAKWLPHAQHPTMVDGIGQLRMMAGSLAQVEDWLDEELRDRQRFTRNAPPQPDQPQVLIVIDDGEVTREEQIILEEGLVGVTLMDLSDSLGNLTARRGLRLVVEPDRLGARSASGVEWFARPDTMTVAEAEALARKLSPYRLGAAAADEGGEEPLLSNPTLLELLGIPGDPMTFDVQQAWRPRPIRDRYRVPFGVGEFGQAVELDIKEAAMEGMGPHGLCIGATGSGKSEFLRTLVLGMLATHSSSTLNFVLVDFKGGATFLGLDAAPHVAAVITNLADQLTLVDRMKDALAGEMNRRQEALKTGGNFKNVWEYEKARENGADLDPLPALFIVVDEFSELLSAKPDFIDLFVAIGRLGRSLQMHMLLASQRLEEGKLRGLDSHLSYRIGLKTFSAAESRAAIGVPDAFELPSVPGSGYLKFDTSTMVRFKASYVSGPYRPAGIQAAGPAAPITGDRRAKLFVPDYVEVPQGAGPARRGGAQGGAPAGAERADRAERARRRRRPAGRPGPARARGVAAAAGHAELAGHAAAAAAADRGPRAVAGRVLRQRPAAAAARPDRQAVRAAPRPAVGRLLGCRGPRRGRRRSAVGQVDDAAHARHVDGADAHGRGGAVLLRRPRWWHARHAAGPAARRWRGGPARPGQGAPHGRRGRHGDGRARAAVPGQGHRLDDRLPQPQAARRAHRGQVRRRLPDHRRLAELPPGVRADRAAGAQPRRAGPVLRRAPDRVGEPVGGDPARRSRTCSAPGSSCASVTRVSPKWTVGSR